MTFLTLYWGAILIGILGVAVAIACAVTLESFGAKIIGVILSLLFAIACIAFNVWYVNDTQSGVRLQNNIRSNYEGGINRTITVYDLQGKKVQEYEGHYDIKWEDDRVLFDNAETGERHVIYLTTFNVITDEVS